MDKAEPITDQEEDSSDNNYLCDEESIEKVITLYD
jgi:hypothetical protein